MNTDIENSFKQWAIVELMGHVRIAGLVTEEERFGSKMGRIDIPHGDAFVTQYFNGSSVYRFTATTEDVARMVAQANTVSPVYAFEIAPKQLPSSVSIENEAESNDDEFDRKY